MSETTERLSDEQIARYLQLCDANRGMAVGMREWDVDLLSSCAMEQSEWEIINGESLARELIALRAERDELLAVAREAVAAMQGVASVWNDMYPAWLVYALLGADAEATVPFDRIDTRGSYAQVAALVALADRGRA